MGTALSIIGVGITLVGGVLLYLYRDPARGDGLMQESWNRRANTIGARAGLVCFVVGAGLTVIGLVV